MLSGLDGLDAVVEACRAGQWDLGENRIQDALPRQAEMATRLAAAGLPFDRGRWHFIGHLQRNKARKAAGAFALLHAVDSLDLAARLSRLAGERGAVERVLLEVNVSHEPQKNGLDPAAAVDAALALPLESIDAVGDSHASAEYRLEMARVYTRRAIEEALGHTENHA